MTSATQSSGVLALALRWNYFFSAALAVGVYFRLWLLPTAPWRSNSGNLFAGLIANILCGGVADQSNIEGVLPRLRAIFERLGYMESSSADLFDQFLKMGMGPNPSSPVPSPGWLPPPTTRRWSESSRTLGDARRAVAQSLRGAGKGCHK